ncbi:MAG TPA: 4Fe-4S dicluster domain-containing protein [Candidatus Deferrimicrobiaceae bacterium]
MWQKRRRIAALLQAAAILALPFVTIGGESAFRFDIPGMRLYLFGSVLWIDEFYLVLAGTLFLLLLGIGITVIFGRIWCGWLCPQTVLPELAAWIADRLPGRIRRWSARAVLLPLTAVVSFSLILYFLPPEEAFRSLFRSKIVTGFFLVQWGILYVMLGPIGPRFCRTVCPYSMLQNALFDGETLVIGFDGERAAECMRCDLCFYVCPVEIDIKKGLTRECIACAECIDACRLMTTPRDIEPFIAYRGRVKRGKAFWWAGVSAAACLAFLLLMAGQAAVSFSVQWVGMQPDAGGTRYRYQIRNRGTTPLSLVLGVDDRFEFLGEREIRVAPRSRSTGEVTIRGEEGGTVLFEVAGPGVRLRDRAGFP